MEKGTDCSEAIIVDHIQSHVSDVTGMSLSTLKHILKEYEHNKRMMKEFGTPYGRRVRGKS
jgi:hypothetical protein